MDAPQHKNGSADSIPRNQSGMDVLERRRGDHLTCVFTYEGKPVVQVNTKALRNALLRTEIEDLRWHDLRIPSPPGTARLAYQRMNCGGLAVDELNPWLSDMLTLHLKACNWQWVALISNSALKRAYLADGVTPLTKKYQ